MSIVVLALAGCFRQASPDIRPSVNSPQPTVLVATEVPEGAAGEQTPFVTPFVPGAGPDITSMPTLDEPLPTLPLVDPDEVQLTSAVGSTSVPAAQPTARVTSTIPFAAGPTYTPVPGAPPVNLNPNASGSSAPSPWRLRARSIWGRW